MTLKFTIYGNESLKNFITGMVRLKSYAHISETLQHAKKKEVNADFRYFFSTTSIAVGTPAAPKQHIYFSFPFFF